jgi:hypothetical protein
METKTEHDIKFIHNDDFISFIHIPTHGCIELTFMNGRILHGTIYKLSCNSTPCKIINNVEDNNEQWLFFNRLYRNGYQVKKGLNIGRKLLTLLCKFADEYKINIFCQVNPYFGMDKYRLIELYKEFNFVNIFDCEQYDNGLIRYYITADSE